MRKRNTKQLKTKNISADEDGFSLLEIMISMSIFSIIIGSIVLFSVRTLEAHTKSQAMQNAIENARFAIETMNKKIRTSHDISDGGVNDFSAQTEIFFVDNVDDSKYCYQFNNNRLEIAKVPDSSAATDCSHSDFNFTDLVGFAGGKIKVSGNFFVKQTDLPNKTRGFVRTVVQIKYNDGSGIVTEKDEVKIQSGVSLRDY